VFYPEGGGQPADRGTLTLADGTVLNVTDVHETNGIIWHTVDALPETAQPGAAVTGTIDWEWRFDKMQQHTGEHILSGILHQMFGAENVGFHIGSDAVRMDTSVPISAEGLREAELAANRIIWENVPVLITYPTPEELAALTYRSKKEIAGQVRIVTIPGADVCACCGTHTRTTGQVGQIKILASENYKGGVRLSVVCGQRALLAAQAMRQRQAEIGALLSAKADQTAVAVMRLAASSAACRPSAEMGTLVSMRTASEPMWKPTFSAPNIWCRMPERMCSPVCCCILSKRHSQSMQPETAVPGTALSGRASTLCQRMPSCSCTSVTFSVAPSGRVRVPRSAG